MNKMEKELGVIPKSPSCSPMHKIGDILKGVCVEGGVAGTSVQFRWLHISDEKEAG